MSTPGADASVGFAQSKRSTLYNAQSCEDGGGGEGHGGDSPPVRAQTADITHEEEARGRPPCTNAPPLKKSAQYYGTPVY
jgi:hypothetical protein